ncbi:MULTISPECIES: TetR family transcriptional regulator [Burkholderia cepacia complex]|uniref:TetR family transcriptional regulator n=1 Tax=Burkholderia cepacia complex TaxID=87882 RepID=UPI00298F4241|nr:MULTISPECIES: TetR family transcriptional regulator [Burkholderia cepacia complex]
MTHQRQNAKNRSKELRLAILRIERGRANTNAKKLTITSVAREAGVTPALIHNHYPAIAEEIRAKSGASSRAQRDAMRAELKMVRESKTALLQEVAALKKRIAQLASINETLLLENRGLRAAATDNTVATIPREVR